jgi:uncharacterized protein (DUF169 family)
MYRELGEKLKDLMKLKREPVAIKWSVRKPRDIEREEGKVKVLHQNLKRQ